MEFSESNAKRIKHCISTLLPFHQSLIEICTSKLSIGTFSSKQFHSLSKEGILCLVIDRLNNTLYFQLYDIILFQKMFEIKLYLNIYDGYTVYNPFFHYIEFPYFHLGISFAMDDHHSSSIAFYKATILSAKAVDQEYDKMTYNYHYDSSGELRRLELIKEQQLQQQEQQQDEQRMNELQDKEKEINGNILRLQEYKKIFDMIEIKDDVKDTKVYKLVEFHTLKIKHKVVKNVYEKNYNELVTGNKRDNLLLQDVKQHKAFSTFFELDDMNDGEQNKTTQRNSKYVEFNPDDFIDIINQPDDNMNVNDNNDNNDNNGVLASSQQTKLKDMMNSYLHKEVPSLTQSTLKVTPMSGKIKSKK
jgi:hypothetical protein